jgi:hypothetical protein
MYISLIRFENHIEQSHQKGNEIDIPIAVLIVIKLGHNQVNEVQHLLHYDLND